MSGTVGKAQRQQWRVLWLGAALAGILFAARPRTFALDPSLDVSQYAHSSWKIREGFPHALIYSIAQTADGYLWLGTEQGLFRFDGVRAVAWQPPVNQHLPSTAIESLLVARDETLWIGTWKGLVSWKNSKLVQYPQLAGLLIMGLVEEDDGTIWAAGFASNPPGKLCAIQNGAVHCYGEDGTLGKGPVSLCEDNKGNLWAGVMNGLWRWKPGPGQFYPIAGEPFGIQALVQADDGALLTPMTGRVARLVGGKPEEAYSYPPTARKIRARTLLSDHDGSLWVGTAGAGVVHVHQGRTDAFEQSDGLSGNTVTSLFQDREGNVWVATTTGLDRFREFAVVTFSEKQGVLATEVVLAARDGTVWEDAPDGLRRWSLGQVTIYHELKAKGAVRQPGTTVKMREVALSGFPKDQFMSFVEDDHGRIWVAGTGGVGYLEHDRFTPITEAPAGLVYSMVIDAKENLWIANWDRGLFHLLGDNLVQRIPWMGLGRQDFATALAPDPLQAGVWIGFSKGGLAYFTDGQIRASYTVTDGLGEGRVNDLRFDDDGTLWAATQGGLSRVKSGRVATITSKNGLPCDIVHWVIEGPDHSFWLNMPCGLVRIGHSELDAWAFDASRRIQTTLFNSSDGVWSQGDTPHQNPHVAKSPEGRLWFVTYEGLSVLDPRHLPINKLPPPVHVEQVIADHKTYEVVSDAKGQVRIPPRVRDLRIDYTALSLVAPEKVLFRYKLEGWDRDWQDAGTRRQAFYSNLPPRNYRFRVMACNNSGVWNEAGTFLDFSIASAYYQTWWFRSLCVLAFLAMVYGAYRVRVGQLRAQEERFRETIESIPAMAFVSLPDGYRTFVNKGWVEYTGMTVEQSLGCGWHAAIHPEDLKRVLGEWEAALASGNPMYYEARYRRAEDGQYRWFMVRVVPQRNKRGKIVKWFGTVTDIEDSKRATEALQRSQFYISEGQRVAQMGSWAFNAAGFEYWSSELFRIHGLDPSSKPPTVEEYLALVHPEDREFMKQGIAKMLDDHLAFDFTKRIVRPDGAIRHVHSVGVPITQGGTFQCFLGTGMDVTEQERLTEELRLSEQYLSEAQSLAHTGSCAIDGTSRETLYWSDEMFQLFGFDPQQGLPMFEQWLQRIHPEDRDKVKLASEKTFLTKVDWDIEFRIVKPDGNVKHIHGIGHPVLSPTGELVQVVGTMVDVTERKRAEEEREKLRQLEADLAHTNRVTMLGEMAASLAHEIKQPIAASITSANSCKEWLTHDPPNLDRALAAVTRIDKYSNRAAEIIDRIRSLYKKSPTKRELVEVNGIIQEMLSLLKCEVDRYSIAMRMELAAELPKIIADRVQLQQVFMNLILNAIQAMKDSGGELMVKSQMDVDGRLLFSVSDTGVGLPTDKLDQIFSAFFTTKPQGSGMGLAISRSIVESHGGRLWANVNDGRGATFHFSLPIATHIEQETATGT